MTPRHHAVLALAGGLILAIGPPASAHGAGPHVDIAGYHYLPADLTVTAGTTVTWTNEDTAPHTVTSSSGPESLSSPELAKGQSWSHAFTVAGTFTYYCAVHPDMTARLTVTPAPTTTATPVPTMSAARPPSAVSAPTTTTAPATVATSLPTTTVPEPVTIAVAPDLRPLQHTVAIVLAVILLGSLAIGTRSRDPS
jgi:plastocyanin